MARQFRLKERGDMAHKLKDVDPCTKKGHAPNPMHGGIATGDNLPQERGMVKRTLGASTGKVGAYKAKQPILRQDKPFVDPAGNK